MKFTDREILERLRAEFDHLWDFYGRDNMNTNFNLQEYCMWLETTILNRLGEAGLNRNSCGIGLVNWTKKAS